MAKVAMERLLRKIIYHFQKLTIKLRRPFTTKVSKVFGLQKNPKQGMKRNLSINTIMVGDREA